MAKKKVYEYTGKGAYLAGIPARDLDEDDWDALDAEQRKLVRDNAKFADSEDTQHAAIYVAQDEPEKPATKKGG